MVDPWTETGNEAPGLARELDQLSVVVAQALVMKGEGHFPSRG